MTRLRYAALGAALAYFFDPQNGRARRKETIKRIVRLSQRQRGRLTARAQPDDVTLARQVESEIFGDADVPKVVLRGEVVSAEMIEELVSKARKVQGVQEVENLLHTPGQAAPMRQ